MTQTVTAYTVVGATSVDIPETAFTTPILVTRNGIVYDIIYTGTPTARQVKFTPSTGNYLFLVPFERAEGILIRNIGEEINVMYKL